MIIAIDKDLNRIHIEDAVAKQECYCPYCGERLSQKRYTDRRSHFAHYPKSICKDSWAGTYDLSDWHYDWQNSFPKENQEVLLALGDVKHRADVLIGRTVTEFQRSDMSSKAFSERNRFYMNLGYKVIWVFDFREQFSSGRLRCEPDGNTFHWTKPRNTFNLYEILTGQVELFFQLRNTEENSLVKIASVSPSGFEEFTVSHWFSKAQFLEYLGVHNGICAKPERKNLSENEEYQHFCQQYGIALNEQQERAVQAVNGANLLLAVPGSGKTTVLVARLGYMILCKNISPNNILAMTFSRQAARDMHRRFCKVFGSQLGEHVAFRTIHAVANQIVKRYALFSSKTPPQLLEDNKRLILDILRNHLEEYPTDNDVAEAQAAITYIKNMSLSAEEIPEQDFAIEKMERVFEEYQKALCAQRMMDFDDQVVYAVRILKARPQLLAEYHQRFPYICVDEAQDTSKAQHELLRLLAGTSGNIFMVGDEDQSIYGFRGAFPQALMDFKNTYANPYILWMETNYRSTPEIVNIASAFIARNQNRYPKSMVAHRPSGSAVKRIEVASRKKQYTAIVDIAKKVPTDTAVIYRDNDSAIPLIDLFSKRNIPYRCTRKEFRFFTNKIVLDVVAFMKLQQNLHDVESFRRIYYKSDFYLDKKTVEFACNSVLRRGISFLDALKDQAKRFDKVARQVRNFEDYVRTTSRMGALEFLQYLDGNGYGSYMQKNHLDHNKFDLLLALTDENPSIPDFLGRLEKLRELTADHVQDAKSGIFLTTAHSSKGLEYDSVYLMDVYDGQFPGSDAVEVLGRKQKMDLIQEERRLFYVAMTRAKNHLNVFSIKGKSSSFVDEILPPPETPKPAASRKFRYSIDQYRIEQEKRAREQAEIKQRIAEELQKRTESQRKPASTGQVQTAPVLSAEEPQSSRSIEGYGDLPVKTMKSVAQILNEDYDQEEYLIYDILGFRRMKCVNCGSIQPEKNFAEKTGCNKGICINCSRR